MSGREPNSVIVCVNRRFGPDRPSCAARGSEALADALERRAAERGLAVAVTRIRCFGRCDEGPNVRIAPGGRFFRGAGPDDVERILDAAAD